MSLKAVRRFGKSTEDYFQGPPVSNIPNEQLPPPVEIAQANVPVNPMLTREIYTLVITNVNPNVPMHDLGVGEYVIHVVSSGGGNYNIITTDGPLPMDKLESSAVKEDYSGQEFFIKRLVLLLQTVGANSYVRDISPSPANAVLVSVEHLKSEVGRKAIELNLVAPPAAVVVDTPAPPPPKAKEAPEERVKPPPESNILPIVIGVLILCVVGGAIFFVVKSRINENREEE